MKVLFYKFCHLLMYLSTVVCKLLDGLLLGVCSHDLIWDKTESLQYRKSRNVYGDKLGPCLLPCVCQLHLVTVISVLGFCYLDVK